MEHNRHSLPRHADSTGVSDGIALLGNRSRPGLTINPPSEPRPRSRGRHSRNSSINEDETVSIEMQPHGMREQFLPLHEPPTPGKLAPTPASAVSSLLRRMTTLRSPISRTKFRSTRQKGGQYATLNEGAESDYVAVDLSSLEGLGYEFRDMSAGPSNPHLETEDTEYVRPQPGSEKPDFQSFVNKRKSVGDGLKNVGAELRKNPTKMPVRGESSRDATRNAINRKKTVRDIGQNLAREKNTIVVVNEAVDLSSLEGARPAQYHSGQTFDTMNMNRAFTLAEEAQSYFFPQDPEIPNWKPFSLSIAYIGSLTITAFALAAIQEVVYQKSARKAENNSGLLHFNSVSDVPTGLFFAWKYLPTMVAIVYAVMFSIMDFDIRRIEPYYQLSQSSGATASASLNLDHLTMFQYFIPFKALRLRQWAVFFSTTGNIIASMAAPALQNPSLVFITNNRCGSGKAANCPEGEELYWVRASPVWSRLVTASYILLGVITIILLVQLRRKSGLLSDPKGIAGIASMATKSHILRDFKGLDTAGHDLIHKRLAHRRFVLFQSSIWQGEWNVEAEEVNSDKVKSPQPPMLRRRYGIPFLCFEVLSLLAVPLISLTKARIVPNTVPWLPVLLATLLKLLFSTFESDVRLMEPFYRLSLGNAPPESSLTLDYQATVYGWMPFRALMNGHYLVALVGLASVALDILTVTVGSFSVDSVDFLHRHDRLKNGEEISSQDETFVSFWVSLTLSVTILVFVILTTSLVYWRRSHAFLPREPSTIASVMAFIYASNMLTDFIDSERLTNAQMETKLKALGKTYGLGWFRGRDGEIHCAIDEEPVKSKYVHGKPYTMAQAGPLESHDTFYSV